MAKTNSLLGRLKKLEQRRRHRDFAVAPTFAVEFDANPNSIVVIQRVGPESDKHQKIYIPVHKINDKYFKYFDSDKPLQIFYGGASSGKSRFLAQRVVVDLLKGERNYLICRKVGRTLRASVFNELTKVIDSWNLRRFFRIHRTDMSITCVNGYQAILSGLDDAEKVKSVTPAKGVLTDIWIEEATEIEPNDLKQLSKRLRGLSPKIKRRTLTFNPIMQTHWIYKEFFKEWCDDSDVLEADNLFILKSTYKDNKFLSEQDIKGLEDETDSYFYNVYTLGNWGVLGDCIFDNWRTENLTSISRIFDVFDYGLDFGFSNDPTHMVQIYLHRATKRLYIYREYVNKGVTNEQIAEDIAPMVGGGIVVCDCAEPKSIAELCGYGIQAIAARKGKDSILHGIQWLKKWQIIIDPACPSIINEFRQYHWVKDKNGNVLNRPVDKHNNGIDALRYACEKHMIQFEDEVIDSPYLEISHFLNEDI